MTPEETYPENTQWVACVRVDHGKHSIVEERYPEAATRKEAIAKSLAALLPNEHLNGVSLIPAKQYWEINSADKHHK